MSSERPSDSFGHLMAVPTRNGIHKGPAYQGRGVPVIKMGEVYTTDFLDDAPRDRLDLTEGELTRLSVEEGDLLFCRTSLVAEGVGHCALVRGLLEPTTFASNLIRARLDPGKAEPRYWFYYFRSRQGKGQLLSLARGTSVTTITGPDISSLQVSAPTVSEQHAIASVLGALDDKIELTRRMNETLEAIARAIFMSWFVDFDPVRARVEGRQPYGMNADTAALFPDAFGDSPLGKIPEGWKVATLASFAALNPESWSRSTSPNQIEYIDLSSTKWGRIESTTRYLWEDAPSRAQRVLRPGDTIVGTVRPANGSYALISQQELTGSTGFAVFRPRRPEFREFIYLAATAPDNIERLAHLADGAAYPAVRPDVVAATEVVVSAPAVIEHFSNTVGALLTKIAANTDESSTLAEIRDTLLPKLLSGEVRVSEMERVRE